MDGTHLTGFCVLLPVRTVGVMGDERTYENVLGIALCRYDRFHDGRLEPVAIGLAGEGK